MSDATTLSPEQALALMREANTRLAKPHANIKDVTSMLVDGGMPQDKAEEMVSNILRTNRQRQAEKESTAKKDLLIGGGILLVGIVITCVSYYGAGNRGSYVVAWGAMLVGAMRLFKGISNG